MLEGPQLAASQEDLALLLVVAGEGIAATVAARDWKPAAVGVVGAGALGAALLSMQDPGAFKLSAYAAAFVSLAMIGTYGLRLSGNGSRHFLGPTINPHVSIVSRRTVAVMGQGVDCLRTGGMHRRN